MKANYFSLKLIILAVLFKTSMSFGQVNPLGINNTFIGLDRENGIIIMSGIAIASYFLTKKDSKSRLNYYQVHLAYFNGDGYNVYMQNFGLEKEYSSWFSLRVEGNIQEFSKDDYNTFGLGMKIYSRYTLFGNKNLSPYFEYGVGIFNALKKFPEDGSTFTFNLTYALGLEYKFTNKNKIRMDYNFIHHSNGNFSNSNPGFDGNGISFSYSWFWK